MIKVNKLLPRLIAVGFISIFIFNPKPAQAFWPFGAFKKYNSTQEQSGNRFPFIIQKLIDRFNLNTDEVTEVLEEAKEEKHEQMKANFEEKLNQAVADAKITEEQKQLIINKHEEEQGWHEELKDLEPEERWQAKKKHQEEMKNWAEENGIDLKGILGFGPKGWGRPHPGLAEQD